MKKLHISPSKVGGTLTIPSSKSHSMRALLFALLARGESCISNLLPSPDIEQMLQACQLLGALIDRKGNDVVMQGGDLIPRGLIDVGNSGIAYRFLTAIAALGSHPIMITGDHSIQMQRPIAPLVEGLRQLGATILGERAPLTVCGPLHPGFTVIEGQDSQFVSALLIAAAFAPGSTEIFVINPGELPWVALTLDWFKRLGLAIEMHDYTYFKLSGGATLDGFSYSVPGDYSTSAFPIAAALLSGQELTLHNLDKEDPQGDKALLQILQKMGANIEQTTSSVRLTQSPQLQGCVIDVNGCIDATPILAVLGCFAKGTTKLINAQVARTKECDRLSVITHELRKMGAKIEEHPDGLTIHQSPLKGADLHAHADHRMGMALTVAALAATGKSTLEGSESIAKTYPNFISDFKQLGAELC